MNTYQSSIKLILIKMALFIVMFLTYAIATNRFDAINSLLLGAVGSYGYLFLLARNVHKSTCMPAKEAVRHVRAGLVIRLGFVSTMAVMALKLPDIQFVPFFIGLYTCQIVMRIDAVFNILKEWLVKKK